MHIAKEWKYSCFIHLVFQKVAEVCILEEEREGKFVPPVADKASASAT